MLERDELLAALKIVDGQNKRLRAEIERLRAENLALKTQMVEMALKHECDIQDLEAQM